MGYVTYSYFYAFLHIGDMKKNVGRLVSLDIFRGLTIAFMIIVNTPGSWEYVYAPLRHAKWNGCTPTDLVFPFFLFIVGVSMWFSLKKYGHELNGSSFLRIARRTASIFALGLFLNIFPSFDRDYSTLRIMGVLQRIALAYGLGALICMTINRDYLWIVTTVLLLLYWAVLAFFGGADPYSLEGNVVLKIDKLILGTKHLYTGFGIPFEPEGLLSTVPSICTVIIGFYTGELVGKKSEGVKNVLKTLIIGAALLGLGLLWNKLFPINKALWTSSYVLYTAGIAMMVLSIIYWLADVIKFQKWGLFFIVFGTNALFSYFLAGIWTRLMLLIKIQNGGNEINLYTWFYEKVCVPVAGNLNGSLMFAIIQMLFIWFIALILYKKKVLIRL
jgi:predicted acyltransferase